ncbi:MAG: hypothetical protein WC390_07220 [Sulfurimonas sp.]|jgi:hypothetical protein
MNIKKSISKIFDAFLVDTDWQIGKGKFNESDLIEEEKVIEEYICLRLIDFNKIKKQTILLAILKLNESNSN